MFDNSVIVAATLGLEVKVQIFEWSSFTAQSTRVSVRIKMPLPAESLVKIPFTPTRPPSGHAVRPPNGSSMAITRLALRVEGALTLAVIAPIPMLNRYVSDSVIDCSCVVVKLVPG